MLLDVIRVTQRVESLSWDGDLIVDHAALGTTYDQYGNLIKQVGGSHGPFEASSDTLNGWAILKGKDEGSHLIIKDEKGAGMIINYTAMTGPSIVFPYNERVLTAHVTESGQSLTFIDLDTYEEVKVCKLSAEGGRIIDVELSPKRDKLLVIEGVSARRTILKVLDIKAELDNPLEPEVNLVPGLHEIETIGATWTEEGDLVIFIPDDEREDAPRPEGVPRYARPAHVALWSLDKDEALSYAPTYRIEGKMVVRGRQILSIARRTTMTNIRTGELSFIDLLPVVENEKPFNLPERGIQLRWAVNHELKKIAVTTERGFLIISY